MTALNSLLRFLGMGLAWAFGWALAGIAVGAASLLLPFLPWWDAFFRIFDAPLPALAVPGFVGGIIFAAVLALLAKRHSVSELPYAQVLAWGAVAGILLSLVPAAMVAVGLASLGTSTTSLAELTGKIMGPLTLLSTVSATATYLLARRFGDSSPA